jgi:hypothetical protein
LVRRQHQLNILLLLVVVAVDEMMVVGVVLVDI